MSYRTPAPGYWGGKFGVPALPGGQETPRYNNMGQISYLGGWSQPPQQMPPPMPQAMPQQVANQVGTQLGAMPQNIQPMPRPTYQGPQPMSQSPAPQGGFQRVSPGMYRGPNGQIVRSPTAPQPNQPVGLMAAPPRMRPNMNVGNQVAYVSPPRRMA